MSPGGILPYKSHIGVWFLRRFGLEQGYILPIFVCNRVWFSRTTGMYGRIDHFNSK